MFAPKKYLGQPVPDLIEVLDGLHPSELPAIDEGRVDLHWLAATVDEITCRPSTLLSSTVPDADLSANHPQVKLPDVVLEDYLGGGGQGWVYLGRVISTKKLVAVKVLRAHSQTAEQAAAREAEICSRFQHPNILRVFQYQKAGAFRVILMELIQGEELSAKSLPAERIRDCFSQLADALCALRGNKIVHCDIKPSNILLRRNLSPVLVDFGVAQDVSESRPLLGLSGTPYFMAPEVFKDNIPHPAWDAYSMGVTASLILVGKQNGQKDLNAVTKAKLSGVFDDNLRRALVADELDEEIRNWVLELIENEPNRRLAAVDRALGWKTSAALNG